MNIVEKLEWGIGYTLNTKPQEKHKLTQFRIQRNNVNNKRTHCDTLHTNYPYNADRYRDFMYKQLGSR